MKLFMRWLFLVTMLSFSGMGPVSAAEDPGCNMERICAAWPETAEAKVTARCGLGYGCDCRETENECAGGLFGGKKHWFLCVCEKKAVCNEQVCAVYLAAATGKAAVTCRRSHCECSETTTVCDTSLLGDEKHIFDCACH